MAEVNTPSSSFPASNAPPKTGEGRAAGAEQLADVCLEVGQGSARSTMYVVAEAGFLIGTVPGCDLRMTGTTWPAVQCLIGRRPGGGTIRKLSTTHPVLVNGESVSTSALAHGDRIQIGPLEIVVHIQAASSSPVKILQGSIAAPKPPGPDPANQKARLQLQEQINQFRDKVVRFEADRKKLEDEVAAQRQELAERDAELERRQTALTEEQAKLHQQHKTLAEERAAFQPRKIEADTRVAEREKALAKHEEEVAAQKQELAALRQELADIRTQLYDRYRERRDRMAGLQESVNLAARKVQERKQQLEAEVREWETRRQTETARHAELETQAADLQQARQLFDEERRLHDARVNQLNDELKRQLGQCQEREESLQAERAALVQAQERHKDDLLQFARSQADLDHRRKQLDERERQGEERLEQLRGETKELENQVVQLDEWHTKLSAVGEKLAKQKSEQEQVSQQLAQRAAALEGQQAALAALRTRLERMREECRQQDQQIAQQRSLQETAEAELRQRQEEAANLRKELDGDKLLLDQERRMLTERAAVLDAAVAQLRQAQDRQAADEQRIQEQTQTLEASTAQQAEAASLLQARITQYDELHKKVEVERENLHERSLLLAQAEQARETLQDQLRRRSEELANRQKQLQDQAAQHEAEAAALQLQRENVEGAQQRHQADQASQRQALEQRAADLERTQAELATRAAELEGERAKLDEANRALAEECQEFVEQRTKLDADRRALDEAAKRAKADFEAGKREVQALQQQLPELELRAGTALERLTHGREQMREHLDEVHTYAGQCRDELDALRAQVQGEAERLQQQEQGLRRGQDEQRLAVAAFRQQLIDWQGQIADMKRLMAHDETRLEQRQVQVAEQARQLGADTVRLAQQADQLQEKERKVAVKGATIDRHLGDMREWYRVKLRELAGLTSDVPSPASDAEIADSDHPTLDAAPGMPRDILSLTGDVDPIDRKLGDLMRSLELIDPDTLTALLVEARRQRRSLRQVLLASGTVTLYQMALIEAGNLDGLMLGPVRVVDRVRATPRETVYRVFDPRQSAEGVLRLLVETEAKNTAHADDFRQRFTKAMLGHPNIAATLEVLDIAGRPAVLQEWPSGLPGNDWPALAGAPGVWYRLLLQAAQALCAAHEAGLIHGHLQPTHFMLTAEGILKVSGFGEPEWLMGTKFTTDAAGDLHALAEIAGTWCAAARQKAPRGKALPSGLQSVLDRLAASGEKAISSATMLLDELEKAAAVVPVNPEAWDRLLRHVKDNAPPSTALRQSA
jgi:chromosome segregation ATPase